MLLPNYVSQKISFFSFVASVLVVCIHAPSTTGYGFSFFFENFIGSQMGAIAVPFFFVVSGLNLGRHINEDGWWLVAVRKRIKTLLIPYFVFCILLGLIRNMSSLLANIIHHKPLLRYINLSPVYLLGLNPLDNPPQPLWYLRALMFFVIVAPVFITLIRRRAMFFTTIGLLFLLGCIWPYILELETNDLLVFTLSPFNIMTFICGLYIGGIMPKLPEIRCAHYVLWGGISLMLILSMQSIGLVSLGVYLVAVIRQVAIILVIVGAWGCVPVVELPRMLRNQAFPIYLLHGVMMVFVLIFKTFFQSFCLSWIGYCFSVVFMVFGSIALSLMLRRYCPMVASFLFGGR